MPAWIIAVLNILGLAEAAAPLVEKVLSGIATYLASAFQSLFGTSASAELESILTHAENVVGVIAKDAPAAIAFVNNAYADLPALLAAEPWLANLLYSTHLIQQGASKPLTRGVLNKVNELAHANVQAKTAKP